MEEAFQIKAQAQRVALEVLSKVTKKRVSELPKKSKSKATNKRIDVLLRETIVS